MRNYLFLSLAALAFTGCSQDETVNQANNEALIFNACMETSETNSRTALGGDNSVVWSEGDAIAVYLKKQKPVTYNLTTGINTTTGSFATAEAVTEGTKTYYAAVFPVKAAQGYEGNDKNGYTFTLNLPVNQYYRENSFYDTSFPMIAMSESTSLTFRNVCGVLNLQLKGNETVTKIELKGNNKEVISGKGTVVLHKASDKAKQLNWETAEAGNAKKMHTILSCGKLNEKGVKLDPATPTSFYITLPPVKFKNGFTITLTNLQGNPIDKTINAPVTITRNQILNMPVLDYNAN